jgi:hypothetical protein
LNGTSQLLFYADGDNLLGGNINTAKKSAENLLVIINASHVDLSTEK